MFDDDDMRAAFDSLKVNFAVVVASAGEFTDDLNRLSDLIQSDPTRARAELGRLRRRLAEIKAALQKR
jgi:hypothetical protein